MSGWCRGDTWLTPHGTLPCKGASVPSQPKPAQAAATKPTLLVEAIVLLYSLCDQLTEYIVTDDYNVHFWTHSQTGVSQ